MDENLIKALGIQNLSDDQKAQIIDRSTQMIEARLMLRLMKSLEDNKRAQLEQVLNSKDKDLLSEFIYKEAPEFTSWVEEETQALRKELSDLGKID